MTFGPNLFNGISLVFLLMLLLMVVLRRRVAGALRRPLLAFLFLESSLVISSMLTGAVLNSSPTVTVRQFWVILTADLFALAMMVTFLLIVVAANLKRDALEIVVRAGFVFWVVYQWPLWRGVLSHGRSTGDSGLLLQLQASAFRYGVALLLAYQLLSVLLAYRYLDRFQSRWIGYGLILLQLGHMIVMVLPALRGYGVPAWFAAPAVVMITYALIGQEEGSRQAV